MPGRLGQQLPRSGRLRNARDFQRVNRTGRRRAGTHFVVVVAPARASGPPRLGLAVSRRVGNAVARNRVKRAVREWFRSTRSTLPADTDWVVVARSGAAALTTPVLANELSELAER